MTPWKSAGLEQHADVLLPVGTWAETPGTFVNAAGDWQRFGPAAANGARRRVRTHLGSSLRAELLATYDRDHDVGPYRFVSADVARRSRKNICLAYLMATADAEGQQRIMRLLDMLEDIDDVLNVSANCDFTEDA